MSIVENRKAFHDYFVEERYEAGLVLAGWEVKAIRAGRAQISDAYVIVDEGALWLIGAHISPLLSASTHVTADPTRTRKLLLSAEEIRRLIPLDLHFSKGRIKLQIALAKGKLKHDKRASEREKEWQREKSRLLRPR
jgi:SsrA-binding protein